MEELDSGSFVAVKLSKAGPLGFRFAAGANDMGCDLRGVNFKSQGSELVRAVGEERPDVWVRLSDMVEMHPVLYAIRPLAAEPPFTVGDKTHREVVQRIREGSRPCRSP